MDDSSVKEIRVVLRRVQDHLHAAQSAFGVARETLNLVEVIHHPTSALPDLNYVTPRQKTAWVSGQFVEKGLARLRELERVPRVQYIDGLFLPLFAQSLADLGLKVERETRIVAYATEQHPTAPKKPRAPAGMKLELVTDGSGSKWWGANWRSERCDILTLGVEPLTVGTESALIASGQQVDVLLTAKDEPIGAVRLSLCQATETAHIVALGITREARTPRLIKLLLAAGRRVALKRGCTLVFAAGETEADRATAAELGFIDVGSMVCYAARSDDADEVEAHDSVVQPVLALRR